MKNIEIGAIFFDECSGNFFRVDSEYKELQKGYWCTKVDVDDDMNVTKEISEYWKTKKEVENCFKDK